MTLESRPQPDNLLPPPAPSDFQTTHWSLVVRAGGASGAAAGALEELCRVYWRPLFAYVRRRGHTVEDAHDLTQELLARLLESGSLAGLDPSKGKFRSFLLAAMQNFLSKEWAREHRQKRGGDRRKVALGALDSDEIRRIEPAHDATPERVFERRWAETVLDEAMARLREEFAGAGKTVLFEQLRGFISGEDVEASYAELAARLEKTVGAVKVAVHRLRQRYAEAIRAEVSKTVAAPEDVDEEIRALKEALRGGR